MLSAKEIIGIRIKEIRKQKGLSGADLAHMLLISQQHVSRIERGLVLLNIEQIQSIASSLGVDICMLLKGIGYISSTDEDDMECIDIMDKEYNPFFCEINDQE